jgi:hypothetical protein
MTMTNEEKAPLSISNMLKQVKSIKDDDSKEPSEPSL